MADSHHREDLTSHHHQQHHCHFPVSKAESPKPLRYVRVPFFADDQSPGKEHRARKAETRGDVLRSAWAVLLHKYVGGEVISFAAFCSPDSPDAYNSTNTLASEEDRSGKENGSDGCSVAILRYRVAEDARLQDVCPVSREPWRAGDLSRGRTVNTATDFSGRLEFVSCEENDEKEEKETFSSVQLRTQLESTHDCVRRFLLLYRSVLVVCLIKDYTSFNVTKIQNAQVERPSMGRPYLLLRVRSCWNRRPDTFQTPCADSPHISQFDMILETDASYSSPSILYRVPKFKQAYAAAISRSFLEILGCLTADTTFFVDQLGIPDSEQKLQMLSWNPPNPFAAQVNACMHNLISAKSDQMPNSEAVCSWEGSLTYLELNRLSSVAAERLRSVGVEPGAYVPFAYEKTIWTVVTMLAILKAGGAFVPLNPQDPRARLEQILQGVGARVVVTSTGFVGLFEEIVEKVVVISNQSIASSDLKDSNGCDKSLRTTVRSARPEDPIFVLFTSGSTGTAKGMIHNHSSICTHALSHGRAMGYQGARVLQFAAYTFDVAIIDTFTTLLFGGCICIPSEEERRNGIVDVINSLRADYAILTPSFAGVIDPAEVPTLNTLAVGGEALPQERIQRFAEKVRLIQIYGPAEVGICLTMEMRLGTRPETVGRALENSSCWLVDPDDSDRLVPIGTVGELVVAGPSLAQGYLNDAERTARSFIAAPAWAQQMGLPSARFYKTGDLLRYNLDTLDGTFDFIGRKDAQIKLRGQRIEPGEIEYHIGHLPGVTVCMATRPEYGCFAGELVAVVQLHDESDQATRVRDEPLCLAHVQSLQIEVVRDHLEKVLPGYMVPSACLVVNCMPFVPSLKVDRRRVEKWLAGMETRPIEEPQNLFAPLNCSEKTAISISMKISEYVALKDRKHCLRLQGHDFRLQDVGVDSIQIISLSLFLQREYAVKVPMKVLLSSRLTIRDLSCLIDGPSLPRVNGQTLHFSQELTHLDIREEGALLSRKLFDEIGPQAQNINLGTQTPIRNVLVTGATGYLGTAILHRLLAVPTIHVYALVRCSNPVSGLQKLRETTVAQGWWQEAYVARVHVWKGDITQPNLGLGKQEVRQILGQGVSPDDAIHALIHSGARVHYSSDYDTLKGVNVTATLSALQLAAQAARLSAFVFVSGGVSPSYDGFSKSSKSPPSASLSSDDAQLRDASGYTQTKLVAETIVKQCMHSGIFGARKSITIVKPGYIIGSSGNGIANRSDFIWRLISGCVEIGAYSRDNAARWLYVADVDTVACRVVAGIVTDGLRKGGGEKQMAEGEGEGGGEGKGTDAIVRVTDGLRLSSLWRILESVHGYQLIPLPQEEWLSRLRSRIFHVGESHLLFPLLHILERDGGCVGEEDSGSMEESSPVEEAVTKNVDYLIQVGFLPKPGESGDARVRLVDDGM